MTTTKTGIVEKVARAIHDARFEGIAPEYRPHPTRDYSDAEYATRLARAAIAAMPDSTQLLQTMAGALERIAATYKVVGSETDDGEVGEKTELSEWEMANIAKAALAQFRAQEQRS